MVWLVHCATLGQERTAIAGSIWMHSPSEPDGFFAANPTPDRPRMRNIFSPVALAAWATFVVVAPPFTASAVSQEVKPSRSAVSVTAQQAAMLKREEDLALERADRAVREMQDLARTKPEKELADEDTRIVAEIRRLILRRQAVRSSADTRGVTTPNDSQLNATKHMQEIQMSFNLQYLSLQSQMQNENRQFTAVSNIMKTKHDTVKNSIGNIR